MDVFADKPDKDMPRVRNTGMNLENDFVIKQGGPYGFWTVSREKGQVPDELSGLYTTPEYAKTAIKTHLEKKK
jgi:hypothetical protein